MSTEPSKDSPRHQEIASHFAQDGEHLGLSFPSKKKVQFKVPAQVIFLQGHYFLDFMPSKCPATRIVPPYNPKFWAPEYDHLLTDPLSKVAQILLDHFDENLRALTEEEKSIV